MQCATLLSENLLSLGQFISAHRYGLPSVSFNECMACGKKFISDIVRACKCGCQKILAFQKNMADIKLGKKRIIYFNHNHILIEISNDLVYVIIEPDNSEPVMIEILCMSEYEKYLKRDIFGNDTINFIFDEETINDSPLPLREKIYDSLEQITVYFFHNNQEVREVLKDSGLVFIKGDI